MTCDGPPPRLAHRPPRWPRNPPLLRGVPVSEGTSFLSSSDPACLFLEDLPSRRFRGSKDVDRPDRRGVPDREGVSESRFGVIGRSSSSSGSASPWSSFPSSSSSRGVATSEGGASAISSSERSGTRGVEVPATISCCESKVCRYTNVVMLRRPVQPVSDVLPCLPQALVEDVPRGLEEEVMLVAFRDALGCRKMLPRWSLASQIST